MAFPVILWDNILRNSGVSLTASSTESGFAVADIADYKPWKLWKSGTLVTGITIDIDLGASGADNADVLGLVNHNITSEGGTIEVKADTTTPPTTVRLAAYTPTYGDVELKTFTAPGNLRYWRVTLAKGGNFANKPYIGELFLGLRTTLTEHLDPGVDPFLKQVEVASQRSEGGQYLGAILRSQTHRFNLAFGTAGAARSAFTTDLNGFLDNHAFKRRPFFFQIDSDDADFKKPVFVKVPDDASVERLAVGGVWSRLRPSIPCEEAYAESA